MPYAWDRLVFPWMEHLLLLRLLGFPGTPTGWVSPCILRPPSLFFFKWLKNHVGLELLPESSGKLFQVRQALRTLLVSLAPPVEAERAVHLAVFSALH